VNDSEFNSQGVSDVLSSHLFGGTEKIYKSNRTISVKKTNLMHCLSSVYFFNEPVHVSGIFVAHHQEVHCILQQLVHVVLFSWLSFGRLANRQTDVLRCTVKKKWWGQCVPSVTQILLLRTIEPLFGHFANYTTTTKISYK